MALRFDREDRAADDESQLLVDALRDACGLDAVGELGDEAQLERVDALRRRLRMRTGGLEIVLGEDPERVADTQRDRPAGAAFGGADDVLDDAFAKRCAGPFRLPDDAHHFAFPEPGPDGVSRWHPNPQPSTKSEISLAKRCWSCGSIGRA